MRSSPAWTCSRSAGSPGRPTWASRRSATTRIDSSCRSRRATALFRYYPLGLVERIRFIKRAQELGFSLEEVRELLQLEDGADRASIRRVAGERLTQIEAKLADLKRMQRVLKDLLTECEHTRDGLPCPIIGTIRSPRLDNAECLRARAPAAAHRPREGSRPTTLTPEATDSGSLSTLAHVFAPPIAWPSDPVRRLLAADLPAGVADYLSRRGAAAGMAAMIATGMPCNEVDASQPSVCHQHVADPGQVVQAAQVLSPRSGRDSGAC